MSTVTTKPRIASRAHLPLKLRKPGPIAAAEAKTHFLQLIDLVSRERTPVTITKRGKALARLVPIDDAPLSDPFGCMKGTVKVLGDIIGPEPDRWEAME